MCTHELFTHDCAMDRLFTILLFVALFSPAGLVRPSCVTVNWTAPGDDAMVGKAAGYDICYATYAITEYTWDNATSVRYPPYPDTAGTPQTFVITGLKPGVTYHFALKTVDERGNWSTISNVITRVAPPDECFGMVGNADCDPSDGVDISDISAYIRSLFIDLRQICCLAEADVDFSGEIDIGDLTTVLAALFITVAPLPDCR